MKCPTCQHPKSEVLRVRDTNRRRQCLACGFRWTTVEQPAVDLAAQIADPAPVLRRVQDLEHQRAQLLADIADLQMRQLVAESAASITEDEVRELLHRLVDEISAAADDSALRDEARMAMREVLERIVLDTQRETPALSLHYAVQAGVNVASPRARVPSPVVRWTSGPVPLGRKRSA